MFELNNLRDLRLLNYLNTYIFSMYKDMCNDVRRMVTVYVLSIPIERALSGRTESAVDFSVDLLNDLFSLVVYYEIAKRAPGTMCHPNRKSFLKNGTLLLVNDYLTNGNINVYKFCIALLASTVVNYILKTNKGVDFSNFEDSLETIIILSLANNSIYDTLAKAIALFIFNIGFKW
jgi:hypothetical protein